MGFPCNGAIRRLIGFIVPLGAFLFFGGFGAQASSIGAIVLGAQKVLGFVQVGDGNALTTAYAMFSTNLVSSIPDAYASVTLTYPGPGSPASLPQINSQAFGSNTYFSTQAAMDAAYPFGTYTFTADADTASFTYSADDYPQSLPYLTGNDYTNLQGMDPSQPFTFDFNPFVAGSTATGSELDFIVVDETQGISVYSNPLLPTTTTSVTIPANTLAGGDSFYYELLYSNFDNNVLPSTGVSGTHVEFDLITTGSFTTSSPSVPEPSTVVLSGLALLGAAALRQKRKAKTL